MPKNEFSKLVKNSLPLVYAIASSHLDVFLKLQQNYRETLGLSSIKIFVPQAFYFSGEKTNLKLELKQDTIDAAVASKAPTSIRTGCPAIYTTGSNKKNVIAEMTDWFTELAEKYYVPTLD